MAIKFESFRGTGGAVTGGLTYKGSYDAATNTPVLTSSVKGDFYIVSVGGTLAGVTLNVGDHIVFNQDASAPITSAMFDVIDNTDAVASVNGQTGVVSLGASDVNALAIANNLSDLNNAGTARTNLGLGTAATKDHGTANGELVILDAVGLPAVDGSQLTNVTSTDSTKLAIANNLSDLNNVTTARTNLGLGTAATKDHGTANGELVILDAVGLPAVDGSQLTNVTGTDSTKLAIANNLSDLNNVATARTNLGLGTAATLDYGTSANNLVQLDGSARLPAVDGSLLTNLPSGASETLQQVTDNGSTTTTNISVAQITMGGDLLADGDLTRTIGSEANRFVTTHGDLNGAVRFKAKANVALSKGDVVYIAGVSGGVPTVDKAQANSSSTMPAFGVCYAAASLNAEVQIVTFGNLEGINTGSFAVGDTLFVSATTAGALTNSAPAGESNLIQNVGRVVKVDAVGNSGIYKIGGAGRTNATPNLDSNKIFLGNGSNQAVSTALSSINLSSFNDDLGALIATNNLSDLNNTATARTNLGLGTAATKDHGTANGELVILDAVGLPAVDGSQLTNVTSTDSTKLAIANNLSDLNNVTTARTNLGLGTAATKNHGTANGELVILDAVGLPAVDGSQLTNVTGTDSTKLAIANNLSDLNNVATARTNLGLGTAATLDYGTSANNLVQLDGSARLPAVDGSLLTNLPSGGGGFTYSAITSASSPVSGAASTHYSADTSGGTITINLPALSGVTAGTEIRVKLKTAGNTLTLDGNLSETIDGSTTYTLTVQNQAVTLVSDGSSNWEVI
jgi:hypothetical protein